MQIVGCAHGGERNCPFIARIPIPAVFSFTFIRRFVVDVRPGSVHMSHTHSNDNTSVKTSGRCITQLAKTRIDPKVAKFTADVRRIILSRR